MRLQYEYYEFKFAQHGVPWRCEPAQELLEKMERRRWRIVGCFNEFFLLRRKRRVRRPRPEPQGDF